MSKLLGECDAFHGQPRGLRTPVPLGLEPDRDVDRRERVSGIEGPTPGAPWPSCSAGGRADPGQGSVTAPRSAPVTRRAYLASTPVVYRGSKAFS
jgi:hypothetical protein